MEEETKETTSFFSPEAVVMFSIAIILDIIGLVCFILIFVGIGVPLSFLPDIIGMIIIGGWTLFRSQSVKPQPKMAGKKAAQAKKRAIEIEKRLAKSGKWVKRLRWLRPLLIICEFIPVIGDIMFSWTLLVYFELKYSN